MLEIDYFCSQNGVNYDFMGQFLKLLYLMISIGIQQVIHTIGTESSDYEVHGFWD